MAPITRGGRPGVRLTWLASALVAATLVAFFAGRWAADAAAGRAAAPALGGVTAAAATPAPPAPDWRPRAPDPGPASPSPAPALPVRVEPAGVSPGGRPSPALVARVAEEAGQALEAARPELTARCVPPGRPPGQAAARFTLNVTFDASGREIARGLSEDRGARSPEVAGCLRRLPLGALRVSAPGANVGVRLALSLP